MFILGASSVIAILTTVGIVFSVVFESMRFFALVPVSEFLFGLTWNPQFEGAPSNCGFQVRPNRNSLTGTSAKKRIDSNTTENTIPTVVRMAITELAPRMNMMIRSTALRDLKSGRSCALISGHATLLNVSSCSFWGRVRLSPF